MKKIIAWVLVTLMILPLVTACKDDEGGEVQTMDVIKNGACTIYYDVTTTANDAVKAIQDAIETATGVRPTANRTGAPSSGAIVLGNLELPDGTRLARDLRKDDFMVALVDHYYVIAGVNHTKTKAAVEHFIENVLPQMDASTKTLTVSSDKNTYYDGVYRVGKVTVGGTALGRFTIQVSDTPTISEWRTAVLLQQHLIENTGYEPTIVKNNTPLTENVIRIGQALCQTATATNAHDYAISVDGTVVEVVAESVFGYLEAQEALMEDVFFTKEKNAPVTLDNSSGKTGNGKDQATDSFEINGDVRIMFNNIHGQIEDGTMPVEQPTKMLSELYLEYLPDVIGMQECTSHSFGAGIKELIASEYALVSGGQNATALFYRTATLECLQSGYFGFNSIETGDSIYADLLQGASKTYDASDVYDNNISNDGKKTSRKDSSKGVTWGIFRHKITGNVFLVGSTHLWWENNEELDGITRKIQMRALRNEVTAKATAFAAANSIADGTIPIFVGGDYNAAYNKGHDSLPEMGNTVNATPFININNVSKIKLTDSTHHTYAEYDKDLDIYVNTNKNSNGFNAAIDHIFINESAKNNVTVNRTDIINDDYAYLSSDHLPLYTDVTFNQSAPKITQ